MSAFAFTCGTSPSWSGNFLWKSLTLHEGRSLCGHFWLPILDRRKTKTRGKHSPQPPINQPSSPGNECIPKMVPTWFQPPLRTLTKAPVSNWRGGLVFLFSSRHSCSQHVLTKTPRKRWADKKPKHVENLPKQKADFGNKIKRGVAPSPSTQKKQGFGKSEANTV